MKHRQIVRIAIIALIAVLPAYAADGDLDTTFGSGGIVLTFDTGLGGATGLAVQSDDKIVVVSRKDNGFIVYRFDVNGSADPTFGNGGEVISNFSNSVGSSTGTDNVRAVAIQSNGKIVVAGSTNRFTHTLDFAMARLNKDGTIDTSFGTAGKVHTNFSGRDDVINDIAIDGKTIIAVGTTTLGGNSKFAVVRYHLDGSLDQSFSTDGKLTIGWGAGINLARSVAVQTNGQIVVAGNTAGSTQQACGGGNIEAYFGLARIMVDGTLDSGFGLNGLKKTGFGICQSTASGGVYALRIQSDGPIDAFGIAGDTGEVWGLARYNSSDGSLDSTFGTGGKTMITGFNQVIGGGPRSMVLDKSRIIISGYTADLCITTGTASNKVALGRFDSSGNPDPTFGPNAPTFPGLVFYSPFPTDCPHTTEFTANSVGLQSDGKIVTAGLAHQDSGSISVALARFLN